MKKTLLRIASLLVLAAMLLSMGACGKKDDDSKKEDSNPTTSQPETPTTDVSVPEVEEEVTLVGNWKMTFKGADFLNELLTQSMNMDISVSSFDLEFLLEMKANGDFSLTLDKDSLIAEIPDLVDDMVEDIAAAAGMSESEVYTKMQITRDEFIAQYEVSLSESMASMESTGTYETEGENIWLIGNGSTKANSTAMVYELTATTLIIDAPAGTDLPENAKMLLPMNFKRV